MKTAKLVLSLALSLSSLTAQAAFEENARRYMGAQEVTESLKILFPVGPGCNEVNDSNLALLGVNSPVTGNPIAPSPTQSTVQWITGCIASSHFKLTNPTTYSDGKEKLQALIGADVYKALDAPIRNFTPQAHFSNIEMRLNSQWNQIDVAVQTQLIANTVSAILGSDEVINDFGLIDPNVLRAKLAEYANANPEIKVERVILFINMNLAVRDEFLSY